MKQKKKSSAWVKPRHKLVRALLSVTLGPFSRLRYGVRVKPLSKAETRQMLILYNHQTAFDQFFVGMAVRQPIYYLATEDIFSKGFLSSLIRYLVAPIPIKKQTTDVRAVMNCLRVAREGGSIAIAPEGNRTYSGRTGYINPAITMLAQKLGLPIAIFRIEGGYGVHPRWSDTVRRGPMRAYISRIIEPEEYRTLDGDAMNELICRELFVDEAKADAAYRHKKSAEYLERALYVCPTCGLSTLESHRDVITCKSCGMQVRYLPTKELCGVDRPFPFRFVAEWYDHQERVIGELNPDEYVQEPLYRDRVRLLEVIVYKRKELLRKEATLALYGDRIVIDEGEADELILPFDKLRAASVLGRNKLNLYHGEQVYQCVGDKRFCALKYVNLYYRYKNVRNGVAYGQFLGL